MIFFFVWLLGNHDFHDNLGKNMIVSQGQPHYYSTKFEVH